MAGDGRIRGYQNGQIYKYLYYKSRGTPRLVIIRRKEKTKVGIILSAEHGGKLVNSRAGKGSKACVTYRILPLLWKLTERLFSASCPLFPKEGIALIIMAACKSDVYSGRLNVFHRPRRLEKTDEGEGEGGEEEEGRRDEVPEVA